MLGEEWQMKRGGLSKFFIHSLIDFLFIIHKFTYITCSTLSFPLFIHSFTHSFTNSHLAMRATAASANEIL